MIKVSTCGCSSGYVHSGREDCPSWVEFNSEAHTISLRSACSLNANESAELQQLIVVAQYMAGMLELDNPWSCNFNSVAVGACFKYPPSEVPYRKTGHRQYVRADVRDATITTACIDFLVVLIDKVEPKLENYDD